MFKQGHSLAWTQTFTFDGPVEEPERYVTSWVLFRPNTWRLTDIYFFQFIELLSRKYNPIMYCHIRDTYSWYIYIYRPFNSYHYYRIYTHLKKKNTSCPTCSMRALPSFNGTVLPANHHLRLRTKFEPKDDMPCVSLALFLLYVYRISLSFPWCKHRTHMKITRLFLLGGPSQ